MNLDTLTNEIKKVKKTEKIYNDCNDLLLEISRAKTENDLQDSTINLFAKYLAKVYPLPDFEYQYNVPQVKNVDYLVFTLNLNGKDPNRNNKLKLKNETIQIPVKGGWRIDFTTGPFVSFFKEALYALHPDTIFSKTKPDSIKQAGAKIVLQSRGKLPHFGIATMLQVYSRQFKNLSFGPCIGIGLSTDLSYSFLGGLGIILGRQQKVSFNAGISFNSIKQLSPANDVGDFVRADYTIKTNTAYNMGGFISLCYNIGLSSKSNNTQTVTPVGNN